MNTSGSEGRAETAEPLRVAQWVRIRWWNACAWYAVTLGEALARVGHRSYILAPPGTPAAAEAAARGLLVPDIGDLGALDPVEWWRTGRALREFLRRESIQLVNVHSGPGHARLALLGRRAGFPVVRTRGDIRRPRGSWMQKQLYRERTAHHLAAADFIRETYYRDLGVPLEKITTLRGGIDLGRLAQVRTGAARAAVRERLGLAPDTVLIGMIGRLSPVKGHRFLLEAMAGLTARFPQVHLVMAGPDAQLSRQDLEETARSLGVSGITHLIGRVEDPLLWSAGLDVAVIASIDSEAICRSALEFMGLGIPLVATRVHAIPEVVVPGAGLLVPPADSRGIAEGLERILASPELRASLSRSARRHVEENYSLEHFGRAAADLFRRVLREWSSHG